MATISVFLFISTVVATVLSAPDVQFSFGRVQGVDKSADNSGRPYFVYFGIPFATPPVGQLRFKRPSPYVGTGASSVISRTTHGPACMQAGYTGAMSEDCLQLNVYTPADISNPPANTRSMKKVMFFIHGGAYVIGTGEENRPSQMVTEYDVIVVVTQYRLAGFGFASTGTSDMPGNYGLHDNLIALQWVKDNIAQFGGDPNDVTIFGESAGSSSVSLLSISPLSKGLFSKGIMQSGTAASTFAINRTPMSNFDLLVEEAGCMPWLRVPFLVSNYYRNIIQCLKSKPASAINILPSFMRVTDSVDDLGVSQYVDFAPVVDGDVIPATPLGLLQDKTYLERVGALDRSYIVGCTNGEGLGLFNGAFLSAGPIEEVARLDNITDFITSTIDVIFPWSSPSDAQIKMTTLEYAYPLGPDRLANIQGLVDLQTDSYFLVPTVQFAYFISQASTKTNVFMYLFDHYPKLKDPTSPLKGSNHGLDLLYEFDVSQYFIDSGVAAYADIPNPHSEPVWDVFTGALTTFAKTGNPTRVGVAGQTITWPRYEQQNQSYMAIANAPEVRTSLASKRVALWTDFLPSLA